jgi:hypothetical protein
MFYISETRFRAEPICSGTDHPTEKASPLPGKPDDESLTPLSTRLLVTFGIAEMDALLTWKAWSSADLSRRPPSKPGLLRGFKTTNCHSDHRDLFAVEASGGSILSTPHCRFHDHRQRHEARPFARIERHQHRPVEAPTV